MSTLEHVCARGGAIVHARMRVPDEPWAWWWGGGVTVGCNHLVCQDCGATVRQQAGFKLVGRPDPATLWSTPDWSKARGVAPSTGKERLYVCRCHIHEATREFLLDTPPVLHTDLSLPWRCGGHPAPPWPLPIDGLVIDDNTNVHELALEILYGARDTPPWADRMANRAFWLEWLVGLAPRVEPSVVAAVHEVLHDNDAEALHRALHWLRVRPQHWPAIELEQARTWAETPNPSAGGRSLGDVAAQALAIRMRWELEHRPGENAAMEQALLWLHAGIGVSKLSLPIAERDSQAFVAAAPAVAEARPAALPALVRALVTTQEDAVPLLLRRLRSVPGIPWDEVKAVVSRMGALRGLAERTIEGAGPEG